MAGCAEKPARPAEVPVVSEYWSMMPERSPLVDGSTVPLMSARAAAVSSRHTMRE